MKTNELNDPRCRLDAELGWSDPHFRASVFCHEDTTGMRVSSGSGHGDSWIAVEAEMHRSDEEPVRGSVTLYLSHEYARQLARDILAALPAETEAAE